MNCFGTVHESRSSSSFGSSVPNPSIERTSQRGLRPLCAAARVGRAVAMTVHRLVTILVLGIILPGSSAGAEASFARKPWSRHCTTQGIPAGDAKEAAYLEAAATRCDPADACVLSCSRSGCVEGIAGGCYHACSRGIPEQLAERADRWEAGPSCRLPPNDSFKPKAPRGSAQFWRRASEAKTK